MSAPRHILVIRFSAMGDVAMTVPVIKEVLRQNADLKITYVSQPLFAAFFYGIPNLTFIPADVKKSYKGIGGLFVLYSTLKQLAKFTAVADLHDSLRTKFLRKLFSVAGVKNAVIDKGRKEKKQLTRFPDKVLKPLKQTTERYADVFRSVGLQVHLPNQLELHGDRIIQEQLKIGISPFAQHKGKIYPLNKMEEVVSLLNYQQNAAIYLFGGSAEEQLICEQWQEKYSHVTSTVNKMTMAEELKLIGGLDVMLSMDSAGMHLASLVNVPVVSVWGATHHFAGFLGYGQSEDNIIGDNINCRPCSVYGNKPCFRGDYACMYNLPPDLIANKVLSFLSDKTAR